MGLRALLARRFRMPLLNSVRQLSAGSIAMGACEKNIPAASVVAGCLLLLLVSAAER
jgi:hypothetical protein